MSQDNGSRPLPDGATPSPLDLVLGRLPDKHRSGKGWTARCPAHDDQNPSLSISEGDDGRVLLTCHTGCTLHAICAALGLTVADLFRLDPAAAPRAKRQRAERREVATYDYRDEHGTILFQVVRYEPKGFRQRRPDGKGGWLWNLDGVRRVLYRLPELLAAPPDLWTFIVEGEKDADRLASAGLIATTNPGGAGKWKVVDDMPLHGHGVCILRDNDNAGEAHRDDVARRLYGKAADVRILELPDLPPKGDVSDWFEAGHTVDELRRIIDATAPYKPSSAKQHRSSSPVRAVLVRASDVKPQCVKWFWRHRIPLRKTTSLSGLPDVGKSMVTVDLAARVSSGTPWPDRKSVV